VAQQELREPVSRAQDVLAEVLAQAHQVAHRLLLRAGHADGGERPGAEQRAERARVAAVGLHPLTGSLGDERRGDDAAVDAESAQLALQFVSGGPGLIAGAHRGEIAPAAHQFGQRLGGVGDLTFAQNLTVATGARDADAASGDVETDEC
jgi:hypothetical protein